MLNHVDFSNIWNIGAALLMLVGVLLCLSAMINKRKRKRSTSTLDPIKNATYSPKQFRSPRNW